MNILLSQTKLFYNVSFVLVHINKLVVYFSQEVNVNSELVCIHDSARPLVDTEDVEKVYFIDILCKVAKD